MMACRICGRPDNRILIRTGTGLCCLLCEKVENIDIERNQALDYLWSVNTELALRHYNQILEGVFISAKEA